MEQNNILESYLGCYKCNFEVLFKKEEIKKTPISSSKIWAGKWSEGPIVAPAIYLTLVPCGHDFVRWFQDLWLGCEGKWGRGSFSWVSSSACYQSSALINWVLSYNHYPMVFWFLFCYGVHNSFGSTLLGKLYFDFRTVFRDLWVLRLFFHTKSHS